MKIDFTGLQAQYQSYKAEIDNAIHQVLDRSDYIMGQEVSNLECELAKFSGARHAIVCSSGTSALLLAMKAIDIGPGDEVITPAFTFVASAETVAFLGAKPVFVDVEYDTFNIDCEQVEQAITPATKAIMPVSLYGQIPNMDLLNSIAEKHDLTIIVDGAQSFGSTYNGITDSAIGDISCTSFFPTKPLGCYGDGGAVFTKSEDISNKIKRLRSHGESAKYCHQEIGFVARMDTIQAAVLLAKLKHYPQEIANRQAVANCYDKALHEIQTIRTPTLRAGCTSVWAQYTIRCEQRDQLQARLKNADIPTAIHYPIPLNKQRCFAYLGIQADNMPVAQRLANTVLSLPINSFITPELVDYIATYINNN